MPSPLDVRFCTTPGGVSLAYAVDGEGPLLVKAANWLTHLDHDQESPVWRHYLEAFTSRFTYLRYDERGSGLSDWQVESLTFEDWVEDLETVVDAAGVDRFALLGISQGGAVAIEYAVRHPDRVSHLILLGAYARGRRMRGNLDSETEWMLNRHLIEVGWGTDHPAFRHVFSELFIPGGTPAQHAWFDDLMRRSTTNENALRFIETFGSIEVSDRCPLVRAPTLVLHPIGDRSVPFDEGRRLASLIPGSRLVPLDSDNHIVLEHEPAWRRLLDEVTAFLTGQRSAPSEPRMTLLMSDIVDSTRLMEVIGDDAWVDVLAWHDSTLRSRFIEFGGVEVDHTGDGFLVSFSSPQSAVACAVEIQRSLFSHRKTAGFAPRVRIAVNSGTVALQDGHPRGRTVHVTARVLAAAGAGDILATAPLRDAVGHGISTGNPRRIPAQGIDDPIEVIPIVWQ